MMPRARQYAGVVLSIAVLGAACSTSPGERPPDGPVAEVPDWRALFEGRLHVVDLTHALAADSAYWPGGAGNPFAHRVLVAHPSGAAAMAAYSTPEHHGTHLDAPIHGADGLATVDAIPVDDLLVPAVVIDTTDAARADPDYRLQVADLERWEAQHGAIPERAVVLMLTGWGRRYSDQESYANRDADGRLHFPGFSEAAARFLVQERGIVGIGIDTLSVDAGAAEGFPAHAAVNGSGGYHLENVANLDEVPASGAYLIVAPIKIAGGSGGQVRIFAVFQ